MNPQIVVSAIVLAVLVVLAAAKPAPEEVKSVKKRFIDNSADFFGPSGYRNSHLQNWQSFFDRSVRALAKRSSGDSFADPFRNPDLQNWKDTFGRYYRSGGFGNFGGKNENAPFKTSNKFQDWSSMYNKRSAESEFAKRDV